MLVTLTVTTVQLITSSRLQVDSPSSAGRTVKHVARHAVSVVPALALIYGEWLAIRSALRRTSCGREETLKIEELAGLRFEVTYLSCDAIAKDEAIRAYAETTGSHESWFLSKRRNQRTLLFRYDPGRADAPPPSITRPSQSTILSPFQRFHRLTTRTARGQISRSTTK